MRLAMALLVLAPALQEPARRPLHRSVDLALGESREVDLGGGRKVTVGLVDVEETREAICNAAWRSRVKVTVDGSEAWLTAGTYNLPVTVGPVQVDCPITRGPYLNAATDYWALEKDARLRIWPAGSPLLEPGTFGYPLRQRWFAGDTWMSNEPVIVGAPKGKLYYHAGLDIGGSEALVDVVSATDGLVVVAGKEALPGHENGIIPGYTRERYRDQVFVLDDRGWYHGYVHLKTIDARAGQKLKRGDKIGLLGKEGGSGGWSHLHYEIRALQPSGKWGTENGYPFLWEAYAARHKPPVLAVAGPLHHQLASVGQPVTLDGSLSRSFGGEIARSEWTFTDGRTTAGPAASRTYDKPGTYSEILKVVDSKGNVDYDFALIGVVDPNQEHPPRLNANYAPTFGIGPGDAVTFKVRTWNTKEGEERWDFGDGSPPVATKSENNYAETAHRYAKPGHYLVRVERAGPTGRGLTHLQVRVEERPATEKGWKHWLDRKLLPLGEARSMMGRFVERQLAPVPLPDSREAWLARRESLRREILEILGIEDLALKRPDPVIRRQGTLQREGYRIEKLTFESWPGLAVPALLYVPDGVKERVPGMVSITGHTDVSKAADYLQQRNVNLALRGVVVLAYDYFGYGDRKTGNHPHHPAGANGHDLRSFSFSRRTATGLEALEAIRALDVLAGQPEVDPDRIGFTGESGGSNTTYWAAALDPRVKLAVPVCSVTTFDYWIRTNVNWDWHQRPPGIRRVADIGTLLALHAPHPLLILSSRRGTDDQEFPLDEAEKSHQWARHVYRLLGAEDAVAHVESITAHGYQEDKRRHLYRWVERWLRPPSPKGDAELPVKVEKIDDLRCGLPEENLTFRDVFAEWVKPLPRPGDPETLRAFLRSRLGLPDPLPAVKAEKVGQEESAEFWIFEPEPGIRLPAILIGGSGPVVLVPGRNRETAARALEAGRRVFAFDPRGTGEMEGYRGNTWGDSPSNWAWFAGRPWPGMWALDLLQAARFSTGTLGAPSVSVDASGLFGWPALLAGAAAPEILPSGNVQVSGSSLHEILRARGDGALADVPGLLERLDLPQIRALWPAEKAQTTAIERGDLAVSFRDNSESPKVLSGVTSLVNVKDAPGFNAYDPDTAGAAAGLNFEHIISGHKDASNSFTPRKGPYALERLPDGKSVRLVRKREDDPWAVSSTLTYTVSEPHAIDFEFRCIPHDRKRFGERGTAIFFWANYMNDVAEVPLHFRGVEAPGGEEKWIAGDAPEGHRDWNKGGTYRSLPAAPTEIDADHNFRLNSWSYDWPRFTKPFYYGRAARDMAFILMFDRAHTAEDEVRFSLFKFKLAKWPRPAWDFQYVIRKVEEGKEYGYKARLVWKKFVSPEDCLKEYESWAGSLKK